MKENEYNKIIRLIDILGYWIADNSLQLNGDVTLDLLGELLKYIAKEVPDEQ